MPDPNPINLFISKLNSLGVRYMVTGAVASIIYGEPRLTHDLDIVIELSIDDVTRFASAFPIEYFYCPPLEVIRLEVARQQRGHFNLIHHKTGFKADVYVSGQDKFHKWALDQRKCVDFEGDSLWIAPVEYVIVRKLEFYNEGGSEKHLSDISGIMQISFDKIDFEILKEKVKELNLEDEWENLKKIDPYMSAK